MLLRLPSLFLPGELFSSAVSYPQSSLPSRVVVGAVPSPRATGGLLQSPLLAVTLLLLAFVGHAAANHLALLSGTLRTYQRHACDHLALELHCPTHTTIGVLYAHYGRSRTPHRPQASSSDPLMFGDRPPYDPCPPIPGQHQPLLPGMECLMQDANYEILQRVVEDCQHQQQCQLQVAPDTFLKHDPCPTIRKYVEVAYKCRPATFMHAVVCEGEQRALKCEANSRLAVYSVLFGRTVTGAVQCPQPSHAPDEECQASYATEVVMKACQGKRSCQLVADAERFGGRPCSSQSRIYMKTVYTCVPRSILKASFQSVLEADEDPELENSQSFLPTTPLPSTKRPSHGPTSNRLPSSQQDKGRARSNNQWSSTNAPGSSHPFFNPTVKPPPHNKVKEIDELSYRQHDQQHLPGSKPDLINCTVTILSGSKEREIGFITEWMRAVGFVSRNLEKLTLYLVLGLFFGLVTMMGVVVGRLLLDRRRAARRTKSNTDQLTSVFTPEDVDGDLDMTAPIGCSTMASGGGHSPTRASSPLPLPEVVRYNTTPRGIVTIRRHDSDIIVPPRSLSRSNNNQLFYS
uniref:Protein eva-1-like isoform X1 n=1 Tax=Hirondellea gigas TaxID=1518452 RepID=A0A6A7G8N0_9CRUS